MYTTYECSLSISSHTKVYHTLNIFQKRGDGGGLPKCDKYHSDDTLIVALFIGWFKQEVLGPQPLPSAPMVEVWWPCLLMSVTSQWDVMKSMITSLLVTLLRLPRLYGKP
ncbi:kiwellin, putative [Medicago truncatula]|uniref:Kiwellin, putative n=1 Tax=Medicago truncatula TaxID=3880 RepID=G7IY65_MEDTR|nr:kiwellin, putative [Medicago truncatula]